jgi:TldD protein
MNRRDFLQVTGMAAGALALPSGTRLGPFWNGALTPIPSNDKRQLADAALGAARSGGASYADVRIGRYLNQTVASRDTKIQDVTNTESYGVGIRVIVQGTWGFAASSEVTIDGVARTAQQAVRVAKANAKLQAEPVQLAPQTGYGEVTWRSPIEKNAFDVPLQEKADLLLAAAESGLKHGAKHMQGLLFLVNEQKYFASTDGSSIECGRRWSRPWWTRARVNSRSAPRSARRSVAGGST